MRWFSTLPFILLLIVVPVFAGAAERVITYSVVLTVAMDGTLEVSERIAYNFDRQRHGIIREIPILYSDSARDYRLTIDTVSVVDEQGTPIPFTVEQTPGTVRLRIGNPNETVIGTKWYTLSYRVNGLVTKVGRYGRISWNVMGGGWGVPIDTVRITVRAPIDLLSGLINVQCVYGGFGSTRSCERVRADARAFEYSVSGLAPRDGVTIGILFADGVLDTSYGTARVIWEGMVRITPALIGAALYLYVARRRVDRTRMQT